MDSHVLPQLKIFQESIPRYKAAFTGVSAEEFLQGPGRTGKQPGRSGTGSFATLGILVRAEGRAVLWVLFRLLGLR